MDLHIITLNIPLPADYGGMIDTFYRLKSLHEIGVSIHLHCFEYGRQRVLDLESLCKTINYYKRKNCYPGQLSLNPYIVSSRKSDELLENLLKDDFPILFDGLHTTFYMDHPALQNRKKIVRLHNIEHRYYYSLSKYERNLFRRLFYTIESYRLKKHQKIIESADVALAISKKDLDYFVQKYKNTRYLAPFHPYNETISKVGKGDYIIYHGDLSVRENSEVVQSLVNRVFSKIGYRCIIAGKGPPAYLRKIISLHKNIELVADPDDKQIRELIMNAHINVLPALTCNGFKIKILIALYAGRYCLVNEVMGKDDIIREHCVVTSIDEEMVNKIEILMLEPFTEKMIELRKKALDENFNNTKNAERLISLVNPPWSKVLSEYE